MHLQDRLFEDDLEKVLDRACEVGLGRFLCNSQTPDDWLRLLELSKKLNASRKEIELIPFFGVHPWCVRGLCEDWFERLERSFGENEDVRLGIGEIGLDKSIRTPISEQEEVFKKQLELAKEKKLPVSMHLIGNMQRSLDILELIVPEVPILLHAYKGAQLDKLDRWLELGTYFSFSGIILDRSNEPARNAACKVPIDRILLESDAPHQPPVPEIVPETWKIINGKPRNEPEIVPVILRELAILRKIEPNLLFEQIEKNVDSFLAITVRI